MNPKPNALNPQPQNFYQPFAISAGNRARMRLPDISSARTTRLFLYDSGGNHPDKTIKYYTVSQVSSRPDARFPKLRSHEPIALIPYPHPEFLNRKAETLEA